MAVLGSLFFNRTIKQFLACEDLDSENGIALVKKLRDSARNSLDRILQIIPQTNGAHREVLQQICLENVEGDTGELFLKNLHSDETEIRSATAAVLSKSTQISPSRLFQILHEPKISKTEIIEVLSFQSAQLKPEQVILNALKLDKTHAEKLLKLAENSTQKLNIDALRVEPRSIQSQSVKIMLLRYFSKVNDPDIAPVVAQFLSDSNKTIVLEALKTLKNLKVDFDASVILPFIDTMAELERELAFEIIRKQANADMVPLLAPWTAGKSELIRKNFIKLFIENATAQNLGEFLSSLEKREWWGRDQAIKCLQQNGSEQLFVAASELAGDESAELSDFVKSNVEQLAARSIDPADLIKVWDNSLHQDWQIRESAIRSIGQSGKRESINQLKLVLGQYPESAVAILKAVSMLGFAKGGEIGFSCLKMSEALVQREALLTIGSLATKKYGEAIRDKLMQYVPKLQSTVRDTAGEVIVALTERFDMSPLQVDSEKYFETRLTRIEETSAENKSSGQTAQATAPTEIVRFQNIEELKKGDLWMDRFRIDREIGRGAMGRVMLAADEMVGEPLILKFMHPELTADGGARERFLREVKYSRKVSHNNVIRIHDMLFKDNLCAISMEYFESRGIDEFLREKKYFKPREGLEVLRQVSDGMAAAHLQNVIHRDLKPSNILMNAAGLVKVVDFGIASASTSSDSTLTKTGSIIGTPAYLSPERAKGYEAHNRCDVYALGIIAYCLFTGQLPYRGEPMSLLFQHLEGNAKPAIEVRREIGIKVSKFIQKMMAVDAEDRFQSMDEVSEAITKLLSKMGW